jgi:glyoxylase-like metal-dependent hydrolase (beta-lactamase superfamily II)/uncharacterized membrane protein YedE/YeeE
MLNFIIGGILIGLGATLLLLLTGYISGMNSMLDTIFINRDDFQYRWKTLWLSTFLIFGILLSIFGNKKVETLPLNILTFVSFFILAFGVRMAKGCTSGHGINGLARLSKRSLVAVLLFFSFAVLTASNFNILKISTTNSIYGDFSYIPLILVILWIIYAFKKTTKKDEDQQINYKNILAIIISASLFSGGLIYSQMYKFSIVRTFLNIGGNNWNPGLLLVFGFAVIVALIGIQSIIKYRTQPIISTCEQSYIKNKDCKFMLPKRNMIDSKLIIGSSLFGVGWGLTAMCPSTFPIRLGLGDPSAYLALVALFVGYKTENIFENLTIIERNDDIIFHQFFDKPSKSFTYIVGDPKTNEVVIIDSVYNKNNNIPTNKILNNIYYCNQHILTPIALIKFCDLMNYNIKYLINTHIHVDHITANTEIKKIRQIPSIIGLYPNTISDLNFENLDNIVISENFKLDIIKTPGHTQNCHSLLLKTINKNILFSGDVLLINGVGRTDLDKTHTKNDIIENKNILFNSLLNLITIIEPLDNETIIYPAHDYTEQTYTTYNKIFEINPFMSMVKKYYTTNDINLKDDFINYFTNKEQNLAYFDENDIKLCVDINKMCGVVDNLSLKELDKLWSKESGACG